MKWDHIICEFCNKCNVRFFGLFFCEHGTPAVHLEVKVMTLLNDIFPVKKTLTRSFNFSSQKITLKKMTSCMQKTFLMMRDVWMKFHFNPCRSFWLRVSLEQRNTYLHSFEMTLLSRELRWDEMRGEEEIELSWTQKADQVKFSFHFENCNPC